MSSIDIPRLLAALDALRHKDVTEGRAAAEPELQRFLSNLPRDTEAMLAVARELCLQTRRGLAVDLAERAVALSGDAMLPRFVLGQIYYLCQRAADAIRVFQTVLAEAGEDPIVLYELAVAFEAQGEIEAARDALDRAIAVAPNLASALHERVLLERVRSGDGVLAKLEALAADPRGLNPGQLVRVHYALGKAFDDLGEPEKALAAFSEGARVFRRNNGYAEQNVIDAHLMAEKLFAGRSLPQQDAGDRRFIFIVGMPRSGTTMTEQILLGDPNTVSVGETGAFMHSVRPWLGGFDPLLAKPASIDAFFAPERLAMVRRNYRLRLLDDGPESGSVTLDKTTTNYMWAPLAAMALPGAKIMHCRRDAVDVCWSLYTTWFGAGTSWSYDFAEIARAYGRYHRMMALWRETLGDALIETDYETMVQDPAATGAALFAQCGLDWRPEALDFAGRARTVVTPSMAQVRKPVHTASLRRVTPYLPMIEPLLDALAKEGAL